MMKNAVEVQGLSVVRGGRAVLDGLDLTVGAGVTGLLGPSGCGKSTLLRSVVGVQRMRAGTVTVLGEPAGSRPLRDRIGYVTQEVSVYDDLTVRENLRFFARVLGLGGNGANGGPAGRHRGGADVPGLEEAIDEVVEAVDLHSHRDAVVGRLSGGQRSRVNLAVALLGRPRLLVLDEPTVGLDPVLRQELWSLFHRLADAGVAVLVSSHVMDEAERCDRLLLMREGRILADGSPEEIKRRAGAADVEAAFLDLVRSADGTDGGSDADAGAAGSAS